MNLELGSKTPHIESEGDLTVKKICVWRWARLTALLP